ncbi:MAG TPA: hypothetical protein VKR58_08370 [Aquella sp.]|nr:hypothetical protein [Aquella sp.]
MYNKKPVIPFGKKFAEIQSKGCRSDKPLHIVISPNSWEHGKDLEIIYPQHVLVVPPNKWIFDLFLPVKGCEVFLYSYGLKGGIEDVLSTDYVIYIFKEGAIKVTLIRLDYNEYLQKYIVYETLTIDKDI